MTVATKGVPLAMVADVLNIPFVIVRRDLKITKVQLHGKLRQVQAIVILKKMSFNVV